jgi:hypothetical protein
VSSRAKRSYRFTEARLLAMDLHELGLAEAWVVYRVGDSYSVRERLPPCGHGLEQA